MQGLRGEFPFCKYGNCCANFQVGAIEKPAAISRLRRAFGLGLAFRPGGYGSPPAATAVLVTYPPLLVILRVGGDDDGLGPAIRDAGRLTPRHLHHQLERAGLVPDAVDEDEFRRDYHLVVFHVWNGDGGDGSMATIASPAITLFEFSRI